MTTLYWDCFSGIAGNMAVASLLDLGADESKLRKAIESLDFVEGPVELIVMEKLNMGIRGVYFNTAEDHHEHEHEHSHQDAHAHEHTHCHDHSHEQEPEHEHEHVHGHDHGHSHEHVESHGGHQHHGPHRGMKEIRTLIENADLTEGARKIAIRCFEVLAQAEATIHGKGIDEVHFHEVGARDSIVDMVGTAVCLDDLGITEVLISPVHLGSGMVKCAHGTIPIPAPATALLLKGFPVSMDTDIPFELTTPTGAAILKGLEAKPMISHEFSYEAVGHGLGSREIGRPNFLRAFLKSSDSAKKKADFVVQFETNLDNVTGELLGHVTNKLMVNGALDACIIPVTMKKGRPGHIFRVLASLSNADCIENLILSELPTLGVRKQILERKILERHEVTIDSGAGAVRGKKIIELDGCERIEIEFDERIRLSTEQAKPVRKIDL